MPEPADRELIEPPARPIPPRYWWLKRLSVLAVVYVLVLLGVRWWWGSVAESRLQAKIAEYRAAGEPVLLEDFTVEPIPDQENGAHFLKQAIAKLSTSPVDPSFLICDFPANSPYMAAAAKLVANNRQALMLAREARSKTGADWQMKITSAMTWGWFPALAQSRQLAKMTYVAALYHHRTGNDAEAVETVRDVLALSRHVADLPPFLITHLTAIAIGDLDVAVIEIVAPDLRVADSGQPASAKGTTATQAHIESLMDELLDERMGHEDWKRTMYGERMFQLDAAQSLVSGGLGALSAIAGGPNPPAPLGGVSRVLLSPAWKLDAVRMMERTTAFVDAASEPDRVAEAWPPVPQSSSSLGPEATAKYLSSVVMPSFDVTQDKSLHSLALRRMAAIALAIRLYELDHGGRPRSLSELVPDYLPLVPLDPFDPAGGEIGYLPDASTPILYSINRDRVDDGGAFQVIEDGYVDRLALDLPFFLNGDRPQEPLPPISKLIAEWRSTPQPTSMEAVVDDREPEDTERDQQDQHRQQQDQQGENDDSP